MTRCCTLLPCRVQKKICNEPCGLDQPTTGLLDIAKAKSYVSQCNFKKYSLHFKSWVVLTFLVKAMYLEKQKQLPIWKAGVTFLLLLLLMKCKVSYFLLPTRYMDAITTCLHYTPWKYNSSSEKTISWKTQDNFNVFIVASPSIK